MSPYVPSNPEVKTLDRYHIDNIRISIDHDEPLKNIIIVNWSKGYLDDGKYVKVDEFNDSFTGQALLDIMNVEVDPGDSRYNAVKKAAWATLVSIGKVDAGSIV